MDAKSGLQLLPGTKKRLGIKVPGENKFLYIGSVVLGAVLVTMFAFGRYEASLLAQLDQLNNQILEIEQKRNKADEAELKASKVRLTLISTLIDKHIYWSQGFSWLENMLQREVRIKNISLSRDGGLTLRGAALNYSAIARQSSAFLADDRIKDLSLGKISTTPEGTIDFSMDIKVDLPGILNKK